MFDRARIILAEKTGLIGAVNKLANTGSVVQNDECNRTYTFKKGALEITKSSHAGKGGSTIALTVSIDNRRVLEYKSSVLNFGLPIVIGPVRRPKNCNSIAAGFWGLTVRRAARSLAKS